MNKLIIILALIGVLFVSGCEEQNSISMDECVDSINNQYYLNECEQYDDYERHYNLITEYENSLPNSSYTIDRHYDECLWGDNNTYYLDYIPNSDNINQIGIQVDCPEDADIFYGAVFCYHKYIVCNETHNYKNGSSIKMVI